MMIDYNNMLTLEQLDPVWKVTDFFKESFGFSHTVSFNWLLQEQVWKITLKYANVVHIYYHDASCESLYELESWACEIKLTYS